MTQHRIQFLTDFTQSEMLRTPFGDNIEISNTKVCLVETEILANQTLDPVAFDRTADLAAGRNTQPGTDRGLLGPHNKEMGCMQLFTGSGQGNKLRPLP